MPVIGYIGGHPSFAEAIRAEANAVFEAHRKGQQPCSLYADHKHIWEKTPSLWLGGRVHFNKCACGAHEPFERPGETAAGDSSD